ncbi:MAG TPA: DNRLRE domain-containing protein [Candidatus Polarisedimenticolia bacterium]|nr:DNRLRE domain-containing protein [Candidatus Polarisedimenticolia bacterium]
MSDTQKARRRSNFRRGVGCAAFLLAQFLGTTPGFSEIILLRPKKDATLIQNANGALANGAGPAIFSGRIGSSADSIRRALLAFDVALIPPGSTVKKAVLSLNLSATNSGPAAVSIRRVIADWGEGTSVSSGGAGAPSTDGDATWLHRFYEQTLWTQPGGDFDAAIIATATVDQPGLYLWETNEAMVAEVQSWLDHPDANFGWILVGDESRPTTVKRFDSRETADEANRPVLYVEYSPPCSPDPLGPGAWSRQCSILLGDAPELPESAAGGPDVPDFAEAVLPCAQSMMLDLGIEDGSPCEALAPAPPSDCGKRTLKTLAVLALNVCGSRLQTSCEVAAGMECAPASVSELIRDLAESYLSGECRRIFPCGTD